MRNDAAAKSWTWLLAVPLVWALVAAASLAMHRDAIAALDFVDTDDAQRLSQVRDWLGGQPWGDIDQYRMNPPAGLIMHWSRLVDLPIAGLYFVAHPLVGHDGAERFAAAFAPQLLLLFAMAMAALAAYRLAGAKAAVLAPLFFAMSGQLLPYFAPLRIDHHGWQVALLVGIVAMLLDPRLRGASGAAAGIMTVAAMMIGLEYLPHIALISVALAAAWIVRPAFGRMLQGYGAGLAVGTVLAYPAFVPTARWAAAFCDAMSPVYLVAMVPAGVAAVVLPGLAALDTPGRRGLAAAIAMGAAGALTLYFFPECAGGPMGALDPRLVPVLDRISEARSLSSYIDDKPGLVLFYGLYPLVGIAAALLMFPRSGTDAAKFAWLLLLALLVVSSLLMLLQLRAMSGAHAAAVVATACLAARWLPRVRAIAAPIPRIFAIIALLVGATSALPLFAGLAVAQATGTDEDEGAELQSCTAAATLAPIARLPRGTIASVIDMGPALLVHTPHRVLGGPYHRSPTMILDAMAFWRAGDDEARAMAARYGSTYVLGCTSAPDLMAAREEAPSGLWARLQAGRIPAWLEPMPVPRGSPLRLYRIKA